MAKTKKRRSSGVAKRRRTPLASGGKKRRKSRGLSEGGTKGKIVTSVKATIGNMLGGGVGKGISKMIPPATGKLGRLALIFFVGAAAHYLGAPNLGGGAVGALTAETFPNGLLNEEAEFADEDVLDEDTPLFLDDDGNVTYLDEQGNIQSLSEEEIELMDFDEYTVVE